MVEDPAPVEELVKGFVSLAEELASEADTAAGNQREAGARLLEALAAGDEEAAGRHREAMWLALRGVVDKLHETMYRSPPTQWNRLRCAFVGRELASAASRRGQRAAGARLREALAAGDEEAAGRHREAMWLALRGVVGKLHETG